MNQWFNDPFIKQVNCFIPNAGYTPQDNRADFGPISPLPTILGNVPIILVVLKIIFSDFSVVWGVLRLEWLNPLGRTSEACWIFTIRNPAVWGEPRGQTHVWSTDHHVKQNTIQSESELTEDRSISNAVMAQHERIWSLSLREDGI